MEDLIKALQIFLKYGNHQWPTHCEHDVMYITGIHQDDMSQEDIDAVVVLGFNWSEDDDCFISYRFGSA